MMRNVSMRTVALTGLVVIANLAFANTTMARETPPATSATSKVAEVETAHSGVFGGKTIGYHAAIRNFALTGPSGEAVANIVAISYVADVPNGAQRPVIFVFNGGPGSSSIWLHMGLMGPKRVKFDDDVKPQTVAPFHYVANTECPLDVADIVFFDPPGTGYSTSVAGKEDQVFGVDQDALLAAKFIEAWLTRNGRLNSPKYIFGESYGSVRAARLAKILAGGPSETGSMTGLTLNGVIILGQSMDLKSAGDTDFVTTLPTMAATAWYHGLVDKQTTDLGSQIDTANALSGEYLTTLYQGDDATAAQKAKLAGELSALVGLPAALILDNNLRVTPETYAKSALGSKGEVLGLYDSRFELSSHGDGHDPVADDPAMGQYVPGYVAAFNDYVRTELAVQTTASYRAIEFRTINSRWDWGQGAGVAPSSTANFADDLAVAMRRNPSLKLMIGAGLYDFVTPVGKARYVLEHMGVDPKAVTFKTYEAGHMAYVGDGPRLALSNDIKSFIRSSDH